MCTQNVHRIYCFIIYFSFFRFSETLSLMGPVEQKVKNFYNSCLLESDGFHQDIRKKTLSSLRLLIKQVGGWSFSDIDNTTTTTTTAANWRFQTALQNIHHLGVWPLFEITVDVDEMDPTKNIFKVSSLKTYWTGRWRHLIGCLKWSQNLHL